MTKDGDVNLLSQLKNIHESFCEWRLSLLLVLSVFLGGTSQLIFSLKIPLYYISSLFIAHAILTKKKSVLSVWSPSVCLGAMLLALYLIYLIPLPVGMWSELSGRDIIVQSFELTDIQPPSLPLSLTPELTFFSIFNFLPLCAVVIIMGLSAQKTEIANAEKTILVIAISSFLIGLIDVLFGTHLFSAYQIYNIGFPVGIFSNINHQASLLAISLPLAIFYAHDFRKKRRRSEMKTTTFGLIGAIILTLGLLLTQSVAGYFLLIISVVFSVLIMNSSGKHSKLLLSSISILILGLMINTFLFENQFQLALDKFTAQSASGRSQVFENSISIAQNFGFFGAGPGSFDTVYRLFENKDTLSPIFVNQAHNEFLQLWIEFGVLGLVWVALGLLWFVSCGFLLSKSKRRSRLKGRIYLVCVFLVLIHSLVDYPLRTMAIGTIFTFFVVRIDALARQYS